MSLILDGVTGASAENECNQFGLIFDEIAQSEMANVAEVQNYCNMTNAVLVKAIDGRFVDQCLYVYHGVFILPGNLTFCYGDPVGALCRPPPITSTTTLVSTPSSTITETTISVVSSDTTMTIVISQPSSSTTLTTVIPGYTTTVTDSSGSAISTITVSDQTLTTAITPPTSSHTSHSHHSTHSTNTLHSPHSTDSTRSSHSHHGHHTSVCHDQGDDHHEHDRQPDVLCRNERFAIINNVYGESRREVCDSIGMELGSITIGNFMDAAAFLFQCLGPLKKAWVGSYNGDSYDGYCIALYTGNAIAGGAIAAPNSCHDSIPVFCTNRQFRLKSLLQLDDNSTVCNQTAKGIHIIQGLYTNQQASNQCDSYGWQQLDLGNFNMLTFIDLTIACNVQFGWVRSVHGYIDPYGMLYFAQGPPVLGVAVGLSDIPIEADILAPAFCQEQPELPTSSATYTEPSSTIVVSETSIVVDTVTSTQIIITPVIVPTVVISSEL